MTRHGQSEWWLDGEHGGPNMDRLIEVAHWAVDVGAADTKSLLRFFEKPWSYPEWWDGYQHDVIAANLR